MKRSVPKCVPLAQPHRAVTGIADAGRVFQHRAEHRLQLTRRSADDLENIGSGGLLLEGFCAAR